MRILLFIVVFITTTVHAYNLHDAHLHYNQSIWKRLPPGQVIHYLTENDIQRAIFSSTPEKGTEMLYEIAPDRIIPFIRPYRSYSDVLSWHHNPEIVDYIREQAGKGIYQGFGEFHMWIEHLDGNSVLPEIMQIAAEQDLVLSAHTDIETIEALIRMQPAVKVIWAHCGFSAPAEAVQQLIEKYSTAYCEMSLYEKLVDEDDNLTPEWKQLMEKYPDRFMVGIDTYKDARWGEVAEHADFIQEWLGQLKPEAAVLIANGNVSRLFPVR